MQLSQSGGLMLLMGKPVRTSVPTGREASGGSDFQAEFLGKAKCSLQESVTERAEGESG